MFFSPLSPADLCGCLHQHSILRNACTRESVANSGAATPTSTAEPPPFGWHIAQGKPPATGGLHSSAPHIDCHAMERIEKKANRTGLLLKGNVLGPRIALNSRKRPSTATSPTVCAERERKEEEGSNTQFQPSPPVEQWEKESATRAYPKLIVISGAASTSGRHESAPW